DFFWILRGHGKRFVLYFWCWGLLVLRDAVEALAAKEVRPAVSMGPPVRSSIGRILSAAALRSRAGHRIYGRERTAGQIRSPRRAASPGSMHLAARVQRQP
ncbi:MAG TPA: hypothetical protein VGY53_11010, partial [Isosphaeraceae bacterium]|nr:hypothetical protein [Isosphaeraceae bacterium]